METIDLLRQRLTVTQELLEVVKIMKTLAAVNIRQYLRAVESLASYHRTVEMGLQIFLRHQDGWPSGATCRFPASGCRPVRLRDGYVRTI